MSLARHTKRVILEIIGWTLVAAGIVALVLPGPGLLMLFGGLALLSQQYAWAERRVEPIKERAIIAAKESVRSTWRLVVGLFGAGVLIAMGALFLINPPAPLWWPFHEKWWLPGGWGTACSLFLSALIALGTIAYSWRHYREEQPPAQVPHRWLSRPRKSPTAG